MPQTSTSTANLKAIKVSVLVTTYNQEKFIAQTIESALRQEADFPYEIVIGEDASTDRTGQIVLELQQKHPDRIRVLRCDTALAERERAVGLGGKSSFVDAFHACRGRYIALLDGDDWWTDSSKLQKQADFLDRHDECAICFHNATIFCDNGSSTAKVFLPDDQKEMSTLEDLLFGNFMFSGSVMFRNYLFGQIPRWFHEVRTGDWALHIINAQYGALGYLKETMAAYRVHDKGFWTSAEPLDQAHDRIKMLEHLAAYLAARHTKMTRNALSYAYQCLSQIWYERGEYARARQAVSTSLRICLANKSMPNRELVGRMVKLQIVRFYKPNLKPDLKPSPGETGRFPTR